MAGAPMLGAEEEEEAVEEPGAAQGLGRAAVLGRVLGWVAALDEDDELLLPVEPSPLLPAMASAVACISGS